VFDVTVSDVTVSDVTVSDVTVSDVTVSDVTVSDVTPAAVINRPAHSPAAAAPPERVHEAGKCSRLPAPAAAESAS